MTRRTTYRTLIGLALTLAALVLAVWVVLRSVWFREWLRDYVTAAVNESINGHLTIDAISGSLFSDVTLHGVALQEAGATVLTVERIDASYDPLEMISGAISINRIHVTRPVVRLVRDARGWNVARIVDRDREVEEPESPLTLTIRSVGIEAGELHVIVDGEPIGELSQVALEAAVDVNAAGTAVDLDGLTFYDERSRTPFELRDAMVRLTDAGTSVDNLHLVAPNLELTGQARLPADSEQPAVDAALRLTDWTAARYAVYLPPDTLPDLPPITGDVAARGRLDALTVQWQLAAAGAQTTGEMLADAVAARPTVAGRVSLVDVDPARFTGQAGLAGRITAEATVDLIVDPADLQQSSGTVRLTAGPARVGGYGVDRLAADASLADGRLVVDGDVAAYGARTRSKVEVASVFDPDARVIAAAGRIDGLDVAALPEATGRPELQTDVTGTYTARLAGDSWTATFAADESTVGTATIAGGATIAARGRGRSLEAEIGADVRDVSGALFGVDADETTVAGRIDAAVSIPDLEAPDLLDTVNGRARVALAESVLYGQHVASATVDATVADGVVDVAALELQAPTLTLKGTGPVAIGPSATTESALALEVDVPDLAELPEAMTQVSGLRGSARIEATVTGTASRPAISGVVQLSEPGYGETADALTIAGDFAAEVPEWNVDALTARLALDGTLLTVAGQEIQQLHLEGAYADRRVEMTARVDQEGRSLEIDGGLAMLPEYREMQLRRLAIAGPGEPWRLEPDADGITTIRYGTAAVDIEPFALVRGSERIGVGGTVGLDEENQSRLAVALENLNVGDLLTLAMGGAVVSGTASGSVELAGALANPVVEASLKVTDGVVADVPFGSATASVTMADRVASVNARIEELHGAALDVVGTVPVSTESDAPLDVRITSDTISLGLLASVTTHLSDIDGTAAIDVHAQGTLAEPRLSGSVRLANAAFTVVPTGVRYRDIALEARFDGDEVVLDRASITDNAGHVLTMAGGGTLLGEADARTVAIDVRAAEFRVLDNELGDVALTIDARVDGRLASPGIAGRITVDRGRLEVDELLLMLASNGGSATPAGANGPRVEPVPADAAPPAASAAVEVAPETAEVPDVVAAAPELTTAAASAEGVIDLVLVMPGNVVLRGQNIRTAAGGLGLGDMNMTVGGTIALRRGPDGPLRLVGAVEVVRGFYEFQGRRFDISEGSEIRFSGGDEINPTLAVVGTREVSGVTAQVEVTGTARRPRLALSSRPPLDEGDILSLIIFNQPVSQLGESQQVALLDRAGDIALGALATSLADQLGRAFDVDLFEIRAPSSTGAGDVSVGTQVNERLFVGFRQEFGSAGASVLSIEYRLTEFLRLLTSVSHGGAGTTRERESTGADLVFRIRY